jgi:hypothetical protein
MYAKKMGLVDLYNPSFMHLPNLNKVYIDSICGDASIEEYNESKKRWDTSGHKISKLYTNGNVLISIASDEWLKHMFREIYRYLD